MKQAQHGNQQQHANADGDDEQADFSSIDFDGRRFRRIALLRTLHEVLPPTVVFWHWTDPRNSSPRRFWYSQYTIKPFQFLYIFFTRRVLMMAQKMIHAWFVFCAMRFFPVKAARKDRKKRLRRLERRFCFKALRPEIQKEAEEILFERRSSIRFKIRGTCVYGVCPFPLCMISISALHWIYKNQEFQAKTGRKRWIKKRIRVSNSYLQS